MHLIDRLQNIEIIRNIVVCTTTSSIDDELVDLYRKGTKASGITPSIIEIGKVKDLLFTAVDQLEQDYNEGLFISYSDYKTSFGLTLSSIEEAISFNNIHEGMHFGYLMAMVR